MEYDEAMSLIRKAAGAHNTAEFVKINPHMLLWAVCVVIVELTKGK